MKKLWKNKDFKKKQIKIMTKNWTILPNIPETQVMQIIKLNNLHFNYTGNKKIRIKGFNPDFLSKNPKRIIEIYGIYHHNLPKAKKLNVKRKKAYNSLGYKLLVIWNTELENPQKVTEKIINFYLN